MKGISQWLSKVIGKGRTMKMALNLWPMYRAIGGKIMEISDDFHYVKIKLPLRMWTRNYVGTLYGGSLYSCVDGIYMVQLINILGKEYVVWDKSASIKFRRPGNQTLYAEFKITPAYIKSIKQEIAEVGEKDYTLQVDLCDKEGKVYAEVEKLIYIAGREFYNEKKQRKKAR